ncbi:Myosin-6 [Hondaea fermentalgiana]|uniref:Myosin-6 n=1 Tax=Hondaea fermentalgiana TaxID=2315210 RepID=A0A2R5G9P0_9STRA|nr:Myosin-6 [Hondaea fermentalgiana]|eukprot:GBG27766.1 Myosin-6 [Hondaea fermentalgiana]
MERKLKKGSKVWVKDAEEAWVEGVILGRYKPASAREDALLAKTKGARGSEGVPSPYRIVVQLGKELKRRGGKTRVVDARLECEVRRSKSAKVYSNVEDLTSIDTLHEPGLLEALEQRYAQDRIYTFTGRILLAVNPFKEIPGMYGKGVVQKYASATADADLPAHIYRVASTAYKDVMERGGLNQTVLVSGESGAGKTETTKIIMRSLAAMSQWRSSGASGTDISERVLRSNPVLETFGNSCTIRNENSSRFGKLIEIKFDSESGGTLGAHITTYLLEKARLTKQFPGERNFHVFYEMAAGGSDAQLERWRIPGSLYGFNFISQKEDMYREEESDADNFVKTVEAMHELGMSEEEIEEVFDVVAGVLHLGNLSFEAVGHDQSCRIRFDDETMLSCEACCDLLKVDADALEFALCRRVIRVRGTDQDLAERGNLPAYLRREDEHFEKSLTVEEAALARDALAMTIYERIFGWLVWRLNQCIQTEPIRANKRAGARARMSKRAMEAELKVEIDDHVYNTQYKIGLLDVFGFEVFERNGFAQLCINYCNETLQHLFNESVFKRDQLEYDEEGIDWTFIRYPDNAACIEMFESKPIGLFPLMDENCMYPGGNDNTLVTKMWTHLPGRFPRFLQPTREDKADFTFRIRHYAGDVVYSGEGFFAQNKNELRQEAVNLVSASRSSILKVLLPPEAKDAAGGADIASFFDVKLGSNFAGSASQAGTGAGTGAGAGAGAGTRGSRGLVRLNSQGSPMPGVLQQTTVGSHFQAQLRVAVEKIRASSAHYVRCLKPNDENVPDYLDRRRLVEQLRYSGVLQIIQVTRAGYPYRFTFAEFLVRYAVLGKRGTPYKAKRLAEKATVDTQKRNCLKIANNAQLVHGEEYQLGKTKVFLRQLSFIILEVLKDERVAQIASVVQRAARKFLELKRKGHKFTYKPRSRASQRSYARGLGAPDAEPVLEHEELPLAPNGKLGAPSKLDGDDSYRRKKGPILPKTAAGGVELPRKSRVPAHDFEDMIQDDDEDWEIDLDAASTATPAQNVGTPTPVNRERRSDYKA